MFQEFIAAERKRMEEGGDIKINNEVLERVIEQTGDDMPLMAPPGGGLPGGLTLPPNG